MDAIARLLSEPQQGRGGAGRGRDLGTLPRSLALSLSVLPTSRKAVFLHSVSMVDPPLEPIILSVVGTPQRSVMFDDPKAESNRKRL